jgi:hypothetical protein
VNIECIERREERDGRDWCHSGLVCLVYSVCLVGRVGEPIGGTKETERPDKPLLSSGWLGLCGIGDFGLGLKGDWFSLGRDAPYIEEDGYQHVA